MRKKPEMTDVVVRFRVKVGDGPLSPEAVIDRLMRNGFEQIMEYEPETHDAIDSWQIVDDYRQFVADAVAWRAHQARKTRLSKAGFGNSPLRSKSIMAKHSDNRCPAVRLADEMNREAKEVVEAVKRLDLKHRTNTKAMRKVAALLKMVIANPDNIIQPSGEAELDWCINVLNNPEE